jgi:hypothetical protein
MKAGSAFTLSEIDLQLMFAARAFSESAFNQCTRPCNYRRSSFLRSATTVTWMS